MKKYLSLSLFLFAFIKVGYSQSTSTYTFDTSNVLTDNFYLDQNQTYTTGTFPS